jgi:Major Facilitator Superfamily
VRDYSPLQAGASALPFAFAVEITSPIAAILSKKGGSAKVPVATGLGLMAAGLAIMASSTAGSGWWHYVFATVLMGAGMGFAMAPATDSIMGTLPEAQAGVGSAVNDTTREIGGVLGVAVMGSVASSAYAHHGDAVSSLPHDASDTARSSLGGALTVAHHIGGPTGNHVADAAREAFVAGASKGLLVAITAAGLGALLASPRPDRPGPPHRAAPRVLVTTTVTQPRNVGAVSGPSRTPAAMCSSSAQGRAVSRWRIPSCDECASRAPVVGILGRAVENRLGLTAVPR